MAVRCVVQTSIDPVFTKRQNYEFHSWISKLGFMEPLDNEGNTMELLKKILEVVANNGGDTTNEAKRNYSNI